MVKIIPHHLNLDRFSIRLDPHRLFAVMRDGCAERELRIHPARSQLQIKLDMNCARAHRTIAESLG